MEFNKALDRIRALIAKAEATDNAEESATYRAKADELMQKYAVEEWQASQKAQTGIKPDRVRIDIGAGDSPFLTYTATLCGIVADFCKCSSIWVSGSGWKVAERQEYCWVYGYPSDLRYFEMLYTSLYLHLSGAMFPRPDAALSVGANVREFRQAGLNWIDVAGAFGWNLTDRDPKHTEFTQRKTGEKLSWNRVVNPLKAAYKKEAQARGEQMVSLGRGGGGNATFRMNAVQGYLARIGQRLRETASRRTAGAELVLRDKSQNIADLVAERHPDLSEAKAQRLRYNAAAYRRGVQHANEADINPAADAGKHGAVAEPGRTALGR